MACQFESPKFSIMVMTTVPFCLIGAFGLLWIVDSAISMTSLLGFLMLVGTVVNNGILYVDTVNQYRQSMDMETACLLYTSSCHCCWCICLPSSWAGCPPAA